MATYLFGGSRQFDTVAGYRLVRVLAQLAGQGWARWHVGDATGADTEFIQTFLSVSPQPHLLSVFSVEKQEKARHLVQNAERKGANVIYPSGVSDAVPFRARLSIRSLRATENIDAAWLVAGSPSSVGTFKTATACAKHGIRVRVFPMFPLEYLPVLETGTTGWWEENDLFGVPYGLWMPGLPF